MIPGYTKEAFIKEAEYFQLGFMPSYTQFGRAINYAEMGNIKNQFIRTRSRPKIYYDEKKKRWVQLESTAFGPGQITHGLLSGALKNYPEFRKKWGKFANEVMMPMYKLHFANSNKNKAGYDPIYGYGGTSGWDHRHNAQYMEMFNDLLKVVGSEVHKEFSGLPEAERTPNRLTDMFISKWRGKTRESDPRYFNAFYGYLNKNYPGMDDPNNAPKLYPMLIPDYAKKPYKLQIDTRPGIAPAGTIQYDLWQKHYNINQEAEHNERQQKEWERRVVPINRIIQRNIDNQIDKLQPIAVKNELKYRA